MSAAEDMGLGARSWEERGPRSGMHSQEAPGTAHNQDRGVSCRREPHIKVSPTHQLILPTHTHTVSQVSVRAERWWEHAGRGDHRPSGKREGLLTVTAGR